MNFKNLKKSDYKKLIIKAEGYIPLLQQAKNDFPEKANHIDELIKKNSHGKYDYCDFLIKALFLM